MIRALLAAVALAASYAAYRAGQAAGKAVRAYLARWDELGTICPCCGCELEGGCE